MPVALITQITEYVTDVNVVRNGAWTLIDSRHLVPGDVLKVKSNWLLPCDLLILQGEILEATSNNPQLPIVKEPHARNSSLTSC